MIKRIALDLDEVVASFYKSALKEIINPYFGTDLNVNLLKNRSEGTIRISDLF